MTKRTAIASALSDEEPDGIYWFDNDNLCPAIACAHCAMVAHYVGRDVEFAHHALVSHLWHAHKLRRVWTDRFDLTTAHAVQLAIPLVLEAETRAEARRLRAVRE